MAGYGRDWQRLGDTPEEAFERLDQLHEGRIRRLDEVCAQNKRLRTALAAAAYALRSYQYGNGSPDLAAATARTCEDALAEAV